MKVLNFGSLNIDYVYTMDHFVRSGETTSSQNLEIFCGGKGLNQSIALARAGVNVYHAGKIGSDGHILEEALLGEHVDTTYLMKSSSPSGHAIIQVTKEGENSIILYGGTNQSIMEEEVEEVFDNFHKGDFLLLQNEVNHLKLIIKTAVAKEMVVFLNPAPMDDAIKSLPLNQIDYLIVNEVEGEQLTGETVPDQILKHMSILYPDTKVLLTLGSRGVMFMNQEEIIQLPATPNIVVVDTTAAGDTFIGYFMAGILKGLSNVDALDQARLASEICIRRKGASPSIPRINEVLKS